MAFVLCAYLVYVTKHFTSTNIIEKEINMKAYYAHHRWKYGTKTESYELELIKRKLDGYTIVNPAIDIQTEGLTENQIMALCFKEVESSDIIVFSSVDGMLGVGTYMEVTHAQKLGIPVLYLFHNSLKSDYVVYHNMVDPNDRLYAVVCCD